jgi:hypothetical protein
MDMDKAQLARLSALLRRTAPVEDRVHQMTEAYLLAQTVISRARAAAAAYTSRTGQPPTVVYLGQQELNAVLHYAPPTVSARQIGEPARLLGMQIVGVTEPSWLDVGVRP